MYRNIFDTHSHYADSAFDGDRDELLAALPDKGVRFAALAGSSMQDSAENVALAQKYGYIYAAVGVHPESVDETPSDYREKLTELVKSSEKVRAIGEIGLDYHYENYDRDKQILFFRQQLELARELSLPVIVHSRNASEDTLDILKEYRPAGVVHCFSGSAEVAREVIKLGMYIGFTGVLTFKNAKKAKRAFSVVPADRLLFETDCPYMAPEPFRGKRCNSSMIAKIARAAETLSGVPAQQLIDITNENARRLFDI